MNDGERLISCLEVIETAMDAGLLNGPQNVHLYNRACRCLGADYECKDVQEDPATAASVTSD